MAGAFVDPPHAIAPDETLAVWFTRPAGLFVETRAGKKVTLAAAEWLATTVWRELERRFPNERVHFMQDFGPASGYESAARARMNRFAADVGRSRVARVSFVIPEHTPMLMRMAASMAAMAMTLLGIETHRYPDRQTALAEHPLTPQP